MRWFQESEYRCNCQRAGCDAPLELDPVLAERLDILRDAIGRPLVITSGLRCRVRNAEVGGSPASRHLTGKAVDLRCADDAARHQLLSYVLIRPVQLFPFIELAPRHVHLDVDPRGVPMIMLGGG